MSRFQEIKDLCKKRLMLAARKHLFGHFQETISEYEEELEKQRGLLEKVLNQDTKDTAEKRSLDPEAEGPTGADGESQPAADSDSERSQPDTRNKTSDSSESDGDKEDKDWRWRNERSLSCSDCGKNFRRRKCLVAHVRLHAGERPYSCSRCGKGYTQKAGLKYHLENQGCGKRPSDKRRIVEKPFSCSDCKRRFISQSHLKNHKCYGASLSRSHASNRQLRCSKCDEMFSNRHCLKTHVKCHQSKEVFSCAVCGIKRSSKSHLRIHMRTHTGEKPFQCQVCAKTFSQLGIMKQHMAVHSAVKPFSCGACRRRFYWHSQIKKHKCAGEQRHLDTFASKKTSASFTDADDIEFWKETRQHQTGVTYRRKNKVSESVKAFSPENKPNKTKPKAKDAADADVCEQTRNSVENEDVSGVGTEHDVGKKPFTSSVSRQGSEESQPGHKSFSCLFCSKGFATGGFLTRHISIHTGEKLLKCIVCEKTCISESHLLKHECLIKSKEPAQTTLTEAEDTSNPFLKCSYCSKEFRYKRSLLKHMRIHSRENPLETRWKPSRLDLGYLIYHKALGPFSCSVCDASFSTSMSLVQHMRIHTKQTAFSCSVCGKEFTWRRNLTQHMEAHSKEIKAGSESVTLHSELNTPECVCESSRLQNKEAAATSSSSTKWIKTESQAEDCGGSEPTWNSDPDRELDADDKASDSSEHDTDDSDFWKETSQHQSSFTTDQLSKGPRGNNTGKKQTNFSKSGQRMLSGRRKKELLRNRPGEKLFGCSLYDQQCSQRQNLELHTRIENQKNQKNPHVKEEPQDVWISQVEEEAHLTKFPSTPVPVKSEDDEEEAQSSQLHLRQSEENREDCGGSEPARNPDPDRLLQPDTDDPKALVSCKSEDSVDSDFWKDVRESTSVKDKETENTGRHVRKKPTSCSDDKPSESVEPQSDDTVDSDFWKENQDHEVESERGERFLNMCNTRLQMETHERKQDGHLQSDTEDKAVGKCKSEDCVDWKDTVESKSVLYESLKCDNGKKPASCSDEKPAESAEPQSDDSVDSDFWKENRDHQSALKPPEVETESGAGCSSAEKSYNCPECGKRFLKMCNMRSHMRTHNKQHQTVKICSICGYTCIFKSHMQIHMRTHTGEKLFSCPVCSKRFAHKASMQCHMFKHTEDKQYHCDVCFKTFTWFTELKYHQCVGESSQEKSFLKSIE